MPTHSYGRTRVDVYSTWIETTLPDGKVVYAMPNGREEDHARADALGYVDELAMTLEHDHLHVVLAHALGLPESPALRSAISSDSSSSSELFEAEESMVLAAQRFLNLYRRGS